MARTAAAADRGSRSAVALLGGFGDGYGDDRGDATAALGDVWAQGKVEDAMQLVDFAKPKASAGS